MQPSERLHALDGLRAAALLLGVVLHGALPYVAGSPWMTQEAPSTTLGLLVYTIHLFRMPLFFLIAGFFGRMLLERRGVAGFLHDRSRRILLPLVAGVPLFMAATGAAYVLGDLAVGQPLTMPAPPTASQSGGILERVNLIHLWFLYYLLIFYGAALGVRSACRASSLCARLRVAPGTAAWLLAAAPVLLALPAVLYWSRLPGVVWAGWPAPSSLIPDAGALLGYGAFFGGGWLLHRHQDCLRTVAKRWPVFAAAALLLWLACRMLGDVAGGGGAHAAYTACYVLGAWYASLGLLGVSLRALPGCSPVRRYLADASYWIYLTHITVLIFFDQLLHPLHLSWILKYPLSIACAMAVLLGSYHYLVRFTFIGVLLNGRRQPRAGSGAGLDQTASRGAPSPG